MAITFTRFANTDVLGPTIFNRLGDELVQDIEDVLDGTEAMASPAVTSFVQSQHNHQNGAGGAQFRQRPCRRLVSLTTGYCQQ